MTTEGHEQRQACSTSGTKKTTLVEQAAFQVFRHSRTREMIPVPSAGGRQAFSVVEIWDFAKAGGESRFYFRDDIWELADIGFEIGAPDDQTCRILQSTDTG
jgi:hypothetical protein